MNRSANKPMPQGRVHWSLRFWRDCGAAEIAEAALVLPILFGFVLGIFQFGRVYLVYSTLQRAAQEGARAAASSPCATCGGVPLTAGQVATQVVAPILQTGHVNSASLTLSAPTVLDPCPLPPSVTSTSGCESSGTTAIPMVCVQRNVILNNVPGNPPTGGSPVCGTTVDLLYPLGFSLPSVSTTPPYVSRQTFALNLRARGLVKEEN